MAVKTRAVDGRRPGVTFGVSLSQEVGDKLDGRLAVIRGKGIAISRSNYFSLLLRYDAEHHIIETILGALPSPSIR
jgi:hypothetical protein